MKYSKDLYYRYLEYLMLPKSLDDSDLSHHVLHHNQYIDILIDTMKMYGTFDENTTKEYQDAVKMSEVLLNSEFYKAFDV
jgi:hypothetical protein